jgi:hypothetical protein
MQHHQHICSDILCILWIYLCVRPHTEKNLSEIEVILTRQPVGIQASSDKETNCERVDLAAEMIEELLLVWGFWDITSRQRLIKGSSRGCNSSLYDLHTQKYAYTEVTVYNTTKFARHCNKKEKGKIYSYPGADSVTHVSFQSDVSVFLYTRSWAKLSRTWRDETQWWIEIGIYDKDESWTTDCDPYSKDNRAKKKKWTSSMMMKHGAVFTVPALHILPTHNVEISCPSCMWLVWLSDLMHVKLVM